MTQDTLDNIGSFTIGAIGGLTTGFMFETAMTLVLVPFIAGAVGILGKEAGKYVINQLKKKDNDHEEKPENETEI